MGRRVRSCYVGLDERREVSVEIEFDFRRPNKLKALPGLWGVLSGLPRGTIGEVSGPVQSHSAAKPTRGRESAPAVTAASDLPTGSGDRAGDRARLVPCAGV
jgi:hypothetical protein